MGDLYAFTNLIVDGLKMIRFYGVSLYTLMQIGIYIGILWLIFQAFVSGLRGGGDE